MNHNDKRKPESIEPSERLLVCEFADELDAFADYCRRQRLAPTDFVIVALQPQVRVACGARGLACRDTLAYFDNDAHRRSLQASHRLTSLMSGEFVLPSALPLRHTLRNTFLYHARFYLNNYLRLLEVLRGVQRLHPQALVHAVGAPPAPPAPPAAEPFLNVNDRFCARLTRNFCLRHGLKFVEIHGATAPRLAPGSRGGVRAALLRRLWRRLLPRLARQPLVLMAAPSYHLDRLAADIVARFPQALGVVAGEAPPRLAGHLRLLWQALCRRPALRLPLDLFDSGDEAEEQRTAQAVRDAWAGFIGRRASDFGYEGCSLAEELTGKVVTDLAAHLGWLTRRAAAQSEMLQRLQPKLTVSPVAIGEFQAWAELGRRHGVPALVVPQKGLVAPSDETAGLEEHYIGRAQVSHDFACAAAQSPLVADYLRWAGYGGKVLRSGNLIFARRPAPPAGSARREKVIVYAPSMKSRKSSRFHVLETLDELLASISDVLAAVAQLPDCRLVVRIHPGEPIRRADIEALLPWPASATISEGGAFEQVLAKTDLLISFSSTSIQEALLNGVPVVLYDRWRRYNHLNAPRAGDSPLPPAAAVYVDEPRRLAPALRDLLGRLPLPAELFRPYAFPAGQEEQFYRYVAECLAREAAPARPSTPPPART